MKHTLIIAMVLSLLALSNAYAQDHHHADESGAKPLSLVEVMQGMDTSLKELGSAIMNEDFELIATSAHSIANHPHIGKEDREALFNRLGDRKEGFITCDRAVHQLAVEVAMAGKENDMARVLDSHSAMIKKATECHKSYR